MKNLITFILIFGLGALFYALLMHFFVPAQNTDSPNIDQTSTTTAEEKTEVTPVIAQQEEKEPETPVVITEDGSLLDGPFVIFNKQGEDTGATVRIIRSPEEMLLQFENWNEAYSPASHVYFSSDMNATEFFNLGPAKMSEDYLIYGIPLDAQLEDYRYVLVYQTQLEETLYYAKIR